MMKHAKKLASLLLALVMAMAMMAVPAFAAQEGKQTGGSIEISDAYKGETYRAYQILYLESYNAETGSYAYKANSSWETWLRAQTTYVRFDAQGYVTWAENAKEGEFAKAALAYAQDETNGISADATVTAENRTDDDPVNAKTTVNISGLKLGYYLVDSSLGAVCSLTTTKSERTITDKNAVPSIEKKVQDGNTYGESNDATIGDTVNFQTTITTKVGARNYVVHDKMDDGLTFGSVTGITLNGSTVDSSNYTVTTTEKDNNESVALEDGCTFEVRFTKDFLDSLKTDDEIVISYTATLNQNADVTNGENNKTKLTFGDKNETAWDTTTTYTYSFDLVKTNSSNTLLTGAEFELYATKEGGSPINLVWVNGEDDEDGYYRIAAKGEADTTTVIAAGKATIKGLGSGTYYLEETTAPAGYYELSDRVRVEITNRNLTATMEGNTWTSGDVHVVNYTGSQLPTTGGMGTTVFYVLGGVLMAGAVVLLVTKKRMGRTEK